nr:replication endonuclease [Vibrio taketomensis]
MSWQSLGKILPKKDIKVYGMRIVEPHQDGTPHHHYLLFMLPEHRDIVSEFKRLAFWTLRKNWAPRSTALLLNISTLQKVARLVMLRNI